MALAALDLMGGAYGRRVVVVVGPGNNGADGRVAADLLARRGARVTVVEAGSGAILGPADLVVDAAFGTGFRGEFRFPPVPAGTPVLAVDIPSGVRGDTGEASGSPAAAARTVTFVALKPGLLQGDGARLAGAVSVADIGLPTGHPSIAVVEDSDVASLVPARARLGNKWSAAVLVVAGSPGMTGAAGLCARAAYRAGAGMVRLGVPGLDLADSPATEAVSVSLPGERVGRRRPRGRVPVLGGGGRAGPRAPAPAWPTRWLAWWPTHRCRWWSTPTASTPSARWVGTAPSRPAPGWCSPPTTGSTPG